MAKGAYIGIGGKARKIKKGYIGINGVARKIKKAYIGIGGKARPCWTNGELEYYGTITPLSISRKSHTASSVGNYAFIAGGHYNEGSGDDFSFKVTDSVETYNTSLTRSTQTPLSKARSQLASAKAGNYVLFAGGTTRPGDDASYAPQNTVDAYSSSLTLMTPEVLPERKYGLTGESIGSSYALFVAGVTSTGQESYAVDCYNAESLTRSSLSHLYNVKCKSVAGASFENCAIFAGGTQSNNGLTRVVSYNTSLTKTEASTRLTDGRYNHSGQAIGNYAIFAGGQRYDDGMIRHKSVEVYDTSLTKTTAASLSQNKVSMGSTAVGKYALFAGGIADLTQTSRGVVDVVEVYDTSLTHTIAHQLNVARCVPKGVTVGNYALFTGGVLGVSSIDEQTSIVDVYTAG